MDFDHRIDRVSRCSVWMAVTLLGLLSMIVIAPNTSAQLSLVRGYVWDDEGNPLEGANVTVDILDSGMSLLDTKWCDATDEEGMYSVTFSSFTGDHEPEIGDTIRVTAKYLSEPPATNSTLVESIPPTYIHYVNVTVDSIVIPEFGLGQGIGLPIAIIGIVAIFVGVSRKRAT